MPKQIESLTAEEIEVHQWHLLVASEHPEHVGCVADTYLKVWIWNREESASK